MGYTNDELNMHRPAHISYEIFEMNHHSAMRAGASCSPVTPIGRSAALRLSHSRLRLTTLISLSLSLPPSRIDSILFRSQVVRFFFLNLLSHSRLDHKMHYTCVCMSTNGRIGIFANREEKY